MTGGAETGDTIEGDSGSPLLVRVRAGSSPDTSDGAASLGSHWKSSGRGGRTREGRMEVQTRKVFPGGDLPSHTGAPASLPGSGCLPWASASKAYL